jgi:hypothetical protein
MPTGVLLCDSIEDIVDLINNDNTKKASGESIELIKIACHSPYDQLPLLINDKRIQTIIKWRLQIGR